MDTKCSSYTQKGTQCTRVALKNGKCKRHEGDPNCFLLEEYPHQGTCITITWCDRAENHAGMEIIGERREDVGKKFTIKYLKKLHKKYEGSEFINLKQVKVTKTLRDAFKEDAEDACILIIRNALTNADSVIEEMKSLKWDRKAKMYGRVVEKTKRHNLCFSEKSSKPDYENGKGTVVAFRRVPELCKVRSFVQGLLPKDDVTLVAEGNYYYNIYCCDIGYHGDRERDFVVGTRFGDSFCLKYQWYLKSKAVSDEVNIKLNHGDVYIMSRKATGFDWKKSSIFTLRHSALLGDAIMVHPEEEESTEESSSDSESS